MSDDKPSGVAQTVVNRDPWEGQKPYLTSGFERAEGMVDSPVPFYPNSTVVPFHGATSDALNQIRSRATAGSSLARAGTSTMERAARGDYMGLNPAQFGFQDIAGGRTPGQELLYDTAAGRYLDANPSIAGLDEIAAGRDLGQGQLALTAAGGHLGANPYLQTLIDQAVGAGTAAVDARFAVSGREGSGLHRQKIEDTAGNIAAGVLAPAYEAERSRMLAAAPQYTSSRIAGLRDRGDIYGRERGLMVSAAPQLTASQLSGMKGLGDIHVGEQADMLKAAASAPNLALLDYTDLDRLGGVGAAYERQGEAELQDKINRYTHGYTAPRDALRDYMATIGGGQYGGSSTSAQPIYSDPLGRMLGYGTQAAGIAGTLFGADGIWS